MTIAPLLKSVVLVEAMEVKSNYENILNAEIDTNKNSESVVYLSNLQYDNTRTQLGYGGIKINTNTDGNKIKLLVDGEAVEFDKGIGAHATSTLVYDISQYKNTYTRFVSYLGVDNSKGDKGDGVTFTISTSQDGNEWNEVKKTSTLKGNNQSLYIDIDLNGANYIKLYADCNGNDGYDHSVYADAKLVKDNYTLSENEIDGLYQVSYYDSIIQNNSIEKNINRNEMTILIRAFVNRVGYESLQRLSNKGKQYEEGITYLLNDKKVLRYFVANGPVTKNGSYQRSVKAFCEIYDVYKYELSDRTNDNFNLRLAVSISLAYAKQEMVTSWISNGSKNSPVKRYNAFKELINSKNIDTIGDMDDYGKWTTKQFIDLPVPMLKWVVDTRLNDDEMLWLSDYVLKEKNNGKNFLDAYNYINYTFGYNYNNPELYKQENFDKYNQKYEFDKYFQDYSDKNVNRLWRVFEEGSVCGGLAQTYSSISEVLGRPSSPCGQPAHASSITWGWHRENNRYEWMIQNDISGWVETGNQFDDRMLGWGNDWNDWFNASYVVLATDAVYDNNYMEATILNLLADCYKDNNTKKEIYNKALGYQKFNYDSIVGLTNCYVADKSSTEDDYINLAKTIIDTYTYYPQVMMDLLDKVEVKITNKSELAKLELLKTSALKQASKATPKETSSVPACTQLANHYLGNKTSELATFSFDGENANKIVINPKYNDSKIRVRYSLDGKKTWKESDEHTIALTQEELNSITADNDIVVGLVGTEATYTIDILKGKTLNSSSIYANDNENTFIGDIENLEFSTDNGNSWSDYVSTNTENSDKIIRFTGDKTVKVRYKANGRNAQSNEAEYKFTTDKDTDKRKYVQIKNISLADCSKENSQHHSGKHLIDGTPNTGYHTTFGYTMPERFYTVEFDKVRFINSIEYQSNGFNGKLRSGRVLTSLDGKTWTESGKFSELGYSHTLKTINLYKPTACKYVKIVGDLTYGNSEGEKDMYLSGNMLNFYEDTTQVYE